MSPRAPDPYEVLGLSRQASDTEVRAAYRRAVQREHPDHNAGSPEAARRFEAVQEAYALIRVQRARAGAPPGDRGAARPPAADPDLDARLARLEAELAQARAVREQIRRAARAAEEQARRAAARATGQRPSDEELGYYRTEDSFGKILADAASGLLSEAREQRVPERLADLLDELGEKLPRRPPEP